MLFSNMNFEKYSKWKFRRILKVENSKNFSKWEFREMFEGTFFGGLFCVSDKQTNRITDGHIAAHRS